MKRYLLLSIALLLVFKGISQNKSLNDYSYVVIPEHFDFLKTNNQYQINSMTQFYLEKNGFNAYMASEAPNSKPCDGLYADVEELRTLIGTRIQLVLKDCNKVEVYRSEIGRSKYKEYDKAYQDALRNAFRELEGLRIKQKKVVLLDQNNASQEVNSKDNGNLKKVEEPDTSVKYSKINGEVYIPDAKFSTYSLANKTFLLRKTAEGFSLYEESSASSDGLLLQGKITVTGNSIKYINSSGKVADAGFDALGNLSIKEEDGTKAYRLID